MSLEPGFDAFARIYAEGQSQVVYATQPSDLTTPVAAMIKLGGKQQNTVLLESISHADGAAVRGRYSILGIKPDLVWRAAGNKARSTRCRT